jgi:hypothetical protein
MWRVRAQGQHASEMDLTSEYLHLLVGPVGVFLVPHHASDQVCHLLAFITTDGINLVLRVESAHLPMSLEEL